MSFIGLVLGIFWALFLGYVVNHVFPGNNAAFIVAVAVAFLGSFFIQWIALDAGMW